MSKEIAKNEAGLTPAQIETLSGAGIIPPGTPPAIVDVFATACRQHGLSPFRKEIYLIPHNTKNGMVYSTVVGIDGLQAKAARSGQFAGVDGEQYDLQPDGRYKTAAQIAAKNERPITCTVTVYRMISGHRCPFTATAVFAEYYPAVSSGRDLYSKAATMPFNMIAKCARAKAIKMAFSEETAGLHIEEEKAAFEDTTISAAENNPAAAIDKDALREAIAACEDRDALADLYRSNKAYKEFADLFGARGAELTAATYTEAETEEE